MHRVVKETRMVKGIFRLPSSNPVHVYGPDSICAVCKQVKPITDSRIHLNVCEKELLYFINLFDARGF